MSDRQEATAAAIGGFVAPRSLEAALLASAASQRESTVTDKLEQIRERVDTAESMGVGVVNVKTARRLLDEIDRLRKVEQAAKELTDWDDIHEEGDPYTVPDWGGSTVSNCVECGQYWPCDLVKLRRALEEPQP